jgi:arylsulfatase A-like enzyme
MRILYIDIDTLRPDHLGCYGYHRNTSPNIDRIANEAVRFDRCYVSDAPCLPSRSSFFSGRFGIHTGVVNHGGINADPRLEGKTRKFKNSDNIAHWPMILKENGFYTVSISPFAERHSAWWFYAGFREMYNPGKNGSERADEVFPYVAKWLEENAHRNNWFLHVNFWDPHTFYSTPESFGNPFSNDPPPSWLNNEIIRSHYNSYGPHSAHDIPYPGRHAAASPRPSIPREITSMADFKNWIDGYDVGIRYADDYVGKILNLLEKKKILDDTVIIISSDHGENQGELNVYGDHQTADHCTGRVPFILRWPGITKPRVDHGFHYQTDLAATILELYDFKVPELWDGQSFAKTVKNNHEYSRNHLVISQCAWSCQRTVLFKNWILIRTYDTGLKAFPKLMLFDLSKDPHETENLTKEKPEIVQEGLTLLENWHAEMMSASPNHSDPMWETILEGGPYHPREGFDSYCKRLRNTGREHHAKTLERYRGSPLE